MNTNSITCPYCKKPFEITDAIQTQMAEELVIAKDKQEAALRAEIQKETEALINSAVGAALQKERQSVEMETSKLQAQADNARELQKQVKSYLDEISKLQKEKDNAEIEARKALLEKEKAIREEATAKAAEDFNTTIRERDETINKLREQITAAKQVAEQGSQQLQGEVLELDIEKALREVFIYDTIDEVKKGERGADIRHYIINQFLQRCGTILWECKNQKNWQNAWVSKLQDELIEEKAQFGVIIWMSPNNYDDFKQCADNIWVVKPQHLIVFASLLRETLLRVYTANKNAEGKDVKLEMLYQYLTGGEFTSRIKTVIEAYDELNTQLNLEKTQTQKRWAAQEKIISKAIANLSGMDGDLQGIAGKDILALPAIELTENEAS